VDWQIIQDGNILLSIRIEDEVLFFIIDNSENSIVKSFDPWKDAVIIIECQSVWLKELKRIKSQMQDEVKKNLGSKTRIPKNKDLYDQIVLVKLDENPSLFPYWKPLKEVEAFIEVAFDMSSSIHCFTD